MINILKIIHQLLCLHRFRQYYTVYSHYRHKGSVLKKGCKLTYTVKFYTKCEKCNKQKYTYKYDRIHANISRSRVHNLTGEII